ncbi:MAG TPA: alpha/beta hydrolase [Armatimonadota bacterium]|nr:alpha/beta hydrolase [Armatimonadota bacterium]
MLFLHGVLRRWQDFLTLLPPLSTRWQCYALDFRGHGGSGRTPGQYRVVDYVGDALETIRTQVDEPAVLYGHSLGAMVACALAAAEPERVRAVVLEDPPFETLGADIATTSFHSFFAGIQALLATGEQSVEALARGMAEIRVGPPGSVPARLADLRDATQLRFSARCLVDLDPDVLAPLLEGSWLDSFDTDRVLAGVRCPALLITGDYGSGGMLPADAAVRVSAQLEQCTRVHLPGVGHQIHWMHAETTLRLVTAFVESL